MQGNPPFELGNLILKRGYLIFHQGPLMPEQWNFPYQLKYIIINFIIITISLCQGSTLNLNRQCFALNVYAYKCSSRYRIIVLFMLIDNVYTFNGSFKETLFRDRLHHDISSSVFRLRLI